MGSASKILTNSEMIKKTAEYLIESTTGQTGYNQLFNGYSTSSDGRHNNATTYFVRHLAKQPEQLKLVESMIREGLNENEDWHAGKVWLGLVLYRTEALRRSDRIVLNRFAKRNQIRR